MDLRQVDLNLLVACAALLREVSVTRAAAELHVTQPAMSQTLRRLRELFGDPLLVRQGGAMVLTPLAGELAAPLERVLADARAVIERRARFDPAHSRRTFVVATTDFVDAELLPQVWTRLAKEAPQVNLELRPIDVSRYEIDLERGEHDAAVTLLEPRPGVASEPLFRERFASLARRGHPLFEGKLTAQRFCSHPHALMSPRGSGPGQVERALDRLGLTRRVALRAATFGVIPPLLSASDLIMTLPSRLASSYAAAHGLRQFKPPLDLLEWQVSVAWHLRNQNDAATLWLRSVLRQAARAIDGRRS